MARYSKDILARNIIVSAVVLLAYSIICYALFDYLDWSLWLKIIFYGAFFIIVAFPVTYLWRDVRKG